MSERKGRVARLTSAGPAGAALASDETSRLTKRIRSVDEGVSRNV